ncbi:uncharacterized protein LOC141629822 [Silene latifolia]|uniref:uncharacterized protein LOC141629822 n=1 Tax=Silene latifolia TaxID=37657 RepID=UPI003D78426F
MSGGGTINTDDNSVQKIDPLSPYYLGSGDLPSVKLSTVLLNNLNYDDWSCSMRMALKSRRKFGFCDGTVKKPTDAFYLGQWEVVHCTVVSWLRATIDSSVLESIPYVEDASVMWSDLAERFAVVDGTSVHNLKTELSECRQTKGMSVTQYYGKLKSLWDALSHHEPPFACQCGKCTCDISAQATKRLDNERLHQFFMGLDRSLYGCLRNQQFQLVPLPTLNRGYHAALQAERLLQDEIPADATNVVAFAVSGPSRTSAEWKELRDNEKAERRKLYCPHCEIYGHDIKSCFIKSGKFPDWWGSRPRTLAELRRSRPSVQGPAAGTSTASGTGSSTVHSGSSSVPNTAGTVHANALQTIPSDRLSGTCNSWIIDTGTSNHVTGDLSLFTETTIIPPRAVGLPNGKRILASKMGTIYINAFISLRRVLFVPNLTCNLISVSQLAADNDFVLQFTNNGCLIQDRSSRKMIGAGELRDGLFLLSSTGASTMVNTVDAIGTYELWHQRLGHPGGNVVKFLPLAHSISVNKNLLSSDSPPHSTHENDPLTIYDDAIPEEPVTPSTSPHSDCGSDQDSVLTTATAATAPSDTAPQTATVPPLSVSNENVGQGCRLKFPNSRLQGYVLDTINSPSPPESPTSPSSSSGTSYDLANFVNCKNFSSRHKIFLAAITKGVEPHSFKAAMTDPGWCNAMKEEIDALESNDTWELTDLPPNKKALGCRWVYRIKYKSDGSIERLKARLVVFGNHQVEGLDYDETFAPVVKMVTIRTFLAVAAVKKWELHQMDVHNAFLHGDLNEEVYMKLPPGFSRGHDGKVCRLKKSLYGLRQAPRCWFAKLAGALRHYVFRQSYSDYSLFTYSLQDVRLHVLIYVDDLVIAGNDSMAISVFKDYLNKCFKMKDLGPLNYFLGIEVARHSDGIFLN